MTVGRRPGGASLEPSYPRQPTEGFRLTVPHTGLAMLMLLWCERDNIQVAWGVLHRGRPEPVVLSFKNPADRERARGLAEAQIAAITRHPPAGLALLDAYRRIK